MAKETQPAETALALPADEPLEPCRVFQGIAGAAAKPEIALSEGAHGELGDEHGAGRVESLDDDRVGVEGLVLEAGGAPGCRVAFNGEQVLCAPDETVERSAVVPPRPSPGRLRRPGRRRAAR